MNSLRVLFKIISGVFTGTTALFMLTSIGYYYIFQDENKFLNAYIDEKMIPFLVLVLIVFGLFSVYFFVTAYKLGKKK